MIMRQQSALHSFMTRFTRASSKTRPLSKQRGNEKKGGNENEKRRKHDAQRIDPFISGAQDEKSCSVPRRVCISDPVCTSGLLCAAESIRAIELPATSGSNRLEAG